MAGGCFFTGAFPDCLEAQESDWKITYIVPRSPFIRYQYPNQSPVDVIGGTNYAIASEPSQGQDPSKLYKVRTKLTVQWRRSASPQNVLWVTSAEYTKRNIPGKIVGITGKDWTSVSDGYSFFGYQLATINTINANGQTVNFNAGSSLSDASNSGGLREADQTGIFKLSVPSGCPGVEYYTPTYTKISGGICNTTSIRCQAKTTAEILSIELEPNQPPEGNNFLFTVRDCKGNLLFTRTDQSQPTVQVFDCEYKKEDEKAIYLSPPQRDVPGMKKGLVCTPTFALDGSKGTKLELVGWPIFQNTHRVTLLDLYSPQCCDKHPKICWECNADEETKDLCPPFTCFKCLNEDGQICCYGDNGTVLKIVSTKDETPDC